jgi:hypothetical protein
VASHGLWRSLVAHLTGGQGVAGSNPVSPTEKPRTSAEVRGFRCASDHFLRPHSRAANRYGRLGSARIDDISATEALLIIVDAPGDTDTDALRHDLGVAITAVRHQTDSDASIFSLALDVARQHRMALPATLASAFHSFAMLEGCLRALAAVVGSLVRRMPRRMESITSQLEGGTFGMRVHSFATRGHRSFLGILRSVLRASRLGIASEDRR